MRILGGKDASGAGFSLGIEGTVQGAPAADSPYLDATGLTVVPGFIDLQVNGGFGHDFTEEPQSIWEVGARLPEHGVTAFCPTIITSPHDRVVAAQRAMAQRPDGYRGAEPIGLHIEGPHLAREKRGTHPVDLLSAPSTSELTTDHVAIVTLAPELDGALDLTRQLVAAGVVVSIGHSMASAEEARLALDAGATMGTHLLNAMPPITAREPGLAGVLLADDRAWFGMIVDGHHHDPAVVKAAFAAAPERFVLVSDGVAAMGMPAGDYRIGSVEVSVTDGAVRNADGALAGASMPIDRELALLQAITGANLPAVVATATMNPSEAIRRWDMGRIRRGARADLVLLDGDRVVATIVGGSLTHLAEPDRWKGHPDAVA